MGPLLSYLIFCLDIFGQFYSVSKLSQVTKQKEVLIHVIDIREVKEQGTGIDMAQDIYSFFWIDATDSYFTGEKERAQFVRNDLFKKECKAITDVLMKGYSGCGIFSSHNI